MTQTKFFQWGGIAFILGNVLFIVNKLDEMSRHFLSRPMRDVISGDDGLLVLIGQLALIIGYLALYRSYSPRVGRSGKIALGLFSIGGIMLAFGHLTFMSAVVTLLPAALVPYAEYFFLFVVLGLALLLIGLVWFGILNLRQPVLSNWQWLPLATGVMGFVGFFLFRGVDITPAFLAFRTLFAFGLVGLGLTLVLEQTPQPRLAQ